MTDATVSVTNTETGTTRDVHSGNDGSATFGALSLTGTYVVTVTKQGFSSEERKGITLRAGEMATLKVKLFVGTAQSEVTVFGTTAGVRSDPQIGTSFDSSTLDNTAILGRKLSRCRFSIRRFVRKGHRRPLRQSDLLRHRGRLTSHHHRHARRRKQR